MQWYYSQNSTQLGPVPEATLRAKVAAGEITGSDMIWREGMSDWMPLSAVKELQVIPASPPPPAPGTGIPDPSSPYASPVATSYVAPPPNSGLAIASFVCGLLALVTGTFITGIPAVICGHMALSQIRNSAVPVGGRGFAIVGLITGYLAMLVLLGVVAIFVLLAVS